MTVADLDTLSGQIQKYRGKGLLVDTNLLLLFLVGLANPGLISMFKPIKNQGFTLREFELLQRLVGMFKTIATTPHILTEVSNHSEKLKGDDKRRFCDVLGRLVGKWDERYSKSADLCNEDHFSKLGLTDTAIGKIAAGNFLVLTVDFELVGHLQKRSIDALNFNHLRPLDLG